MQEIRILSPIRKPRAGAQDVRQDFMTATEASMELGVSRNRVARLCREGRFSGAAKLGQVWLIPRAAVRGHKRLPPGRRPRASRSSFGY